MSSTNIQKNLNPCHTLTFNDDSALHPVSINACLYSALFYRQADFEVAPNGLKVPVGQALHDDFDVPPVLSK